MARENLGGGLDSLNSDTHELGTLTEAGVLYPDFIIKSDSGEPVQIESPELMFTGDYARDGNDLILSLNNIEHVIENYFGHEAGSSLVAPNGAFLTFDAVSALAGSPTPAQYAQLSGAGGGLLKIGEVVKLSGSASTKQQDGVEAELAIGVPVYQGDVVNTGADSNLGISFSDGTIFSMSPNSTMVLDELVYDPEDGSNNSMVFNLVQGSFVFATGAIAPSGGMKIETPIATMGIRGTTPKVTIDTELGIAEFSVLPDPSNGDVGSYVLINKATGAIMGTVESAGSKWLVTSLSGEPVEIKKIRP